MAKDNRKANIATPVVQVSPKDKQFFISLERLVIILALEGVLITIVGLHQKGTTNSNLMLLGSLEFYFGIALLFSTFYLLNLRKRALIVMLAVQVGMFFASLQVLVNNFQSSLNITSLIMSLFSMGLSLAIAQFLFRRRNYFKNKVKKVRPGLAAKNQKV